MTGSASFGDGGVVRLNTVDLCSVESRLRTLSCAMIGSLRAKNSVAAGVIAVPVSVQNEAQLFVSKSFECRPDLVGEWRILIVNDQKAVITNRDADVSTRAFEHVNVAGNFGRFNLHLGKVSLRVRRDGTDTAKELATETSSRLFSPTLLDSSTLL